MAERRGWLVRALRVLGAGSFAGAVLGLVGLVVLAVLYREHVVANPGPHLERRHIRSVIAQESPVYYRDGITRVGVFFEAEHREYVPWEELPLAWVMGIVAAEDASFFHHYGVDPFGIARAMRDNLRAGTMVAGGSTLTQQTAKNLYYRPDRSARSKAVELVNALRLEAHYEKSEILTFYANQFHVTGNGRGLGIGARHFFDKDVEDLTVTEAAFLAGLVKAPARYDAFLGDEARRAAAVEAARGRTAYVLGRIVEVPVGDLVGPEPRDAAGRAAWAARLAAGEAVQAEAARILAEGVKLEFRRGVFRYEASAVLDEVARRLAEPPLSDVLAAAGVEDPATGGLQVITTLDPEVQAAATYGLWHHLTDVGIELEALGADALVVSGRGPRFDPDRPPVAREFRLAAVTGERLVDGKRVVDLDVGGHGCLVDRDALVRIAGDIVGGAAANRDAKAKTADVDALVDALPKGTVVHASVREVRADGARCDLELTPELQGAALVLEGGRIRAMVGGNDNRNFNRATALRQMGSTWKPLVFHAALQLGWHPDDALDNRRGVFPFSTTFYYPRPDHEPAPVVSMSWAGVNSENLASVWLLYHLTDRLDGEQVRALATSLDLARRAAETEPEYRLRIQKAGVLPTHGRLEEVAFLQARYEVLSGISDERHPEDELALRSLLFGWGFANEREQAGSEGPKGRATKERALDNSWRHVSGLVSECRARYDALADAFDDRSAPEPSLVEGLSVLLDGEAIEVACGTPPEGYAPPDQDFVDTVWGASAREPDATAEEPANNNPLGWLERLLQRRKEPKLAPVEDLLLDDRLHLATVEVVQEAIDRRSLAMSLRTEPVDLYDPEVLYWHPDFRVLLGLKYVASLAEQYGVQTEIPPVLSMPLGATEITLEEATSVYAGLVSGQSWSFAGSAAGAAVGSVSSPALLIEEIRDVDGNVLYRATPEATPVALPGTPELTAHILRNVVRHGTGRRATALTESGLQIPVGGKTGTTNDFRNAAFLGFAPVWSAGAYRSADGYAVGVYVGYDDNRPLVREGIRLAGASGALPAWVATIGAMADRGLLGEPGTPPTIDDVAWPLAWSPGLTEVVVDPATGLPLDAEVERTPETAVVLVQESAAETPLEYHPRDRPPRIFPRTDEWELDEPLNGDW